MKNFKNSIFYLIPSGISGILPFITLPIFTRILTTVDYGNLALAQAYAIFLVGISNFGLSFGYERNFFEYDNPKRTSGLLYSTLLFVVISFFLFGLLTLFYINDISNFLFKNSDNNNLILVTYCAVGSTSLKTYFITYFKNTKNANSYVTYILIESLLLALISFLFIVFLKIGIIGIPLAQLLSSSFVFFLLFFKFLKILPFSLDTKAFKDSFNISLPLTPRIFFGVIGSQFDKYIIGIVSTLGSLGVYSIAQRLSSLIFVFMTAIQNAWGPVVYKMMFDKKILNKNIKIGEFLFPYYYFTILFGILITVFSEELIYIFAPIEYSSAAEMISILAILQCTFFFQKQNQLIFAKKTYLISVLTLIGILLNIIINWFFVQNWGAVGVAWGTLLSGVMIGCISFYFSQKSFKIYFSRKTYGMIFIIYLISSLISITLIHTEWSYKIELSIKFFLLLIYIYTGLRLRIINKKEILQVKNYFINKLKS